MAKQLKYYKGELIEYDILKLVDFYDDALRTPTIPYDFNSPGAIARAEYLAFSLSEALAKMQGIGLSANQVGLTERVCAVNMGNEIWVMFNPVVLSASEDKAEFGEGCLSYPGLYLKLARPKHIAVKFQAIGGQEVVQEFDGLTAVCVQHEIDHLDGIMYTDKVSPIKLQQAKKKVKSNLKKMQYMTDNSNIEEKPEPKIQIDPVQIKKPPEKFVYKIG